MAALRGGEEEGPSVGDATALVGAEGAHVGFLKKVLVVGQRGEAFLQVGAQRGFAGLNVRGKPTGLIGRGRGVYVRAPGAT